MAGAGHRKECPRPIRFPNGFWLDSLDRYRSFDEYVCDRGFAAVHRQRSPLHQRGRLKHGGFVNFNWNYFKHIKGFIEK
jgi:hypothetical protein